MRVSVIIPTYNVEKYITETLGSLRGQTHQDWEGIVVDDGSKDKTVQRVRQIVGQETRIKLIEQANQGGAAARENGFDASTGEALLFFDHDDRLRPRALEALTAKLENKPATYGLAAYMDSAGETVDSGKYERYLGRRFDCYGRKLDPTEDTNFETLTTRNWIPIGSMLIRREAKLKAGRFDPAFGHSHDWEMWLRIALLGPIGFVDEVVYDYRVHSASMSSADLFGQYDLAVWKHFIESPNVPPERREQMRLGYRLVHRRLLRKKLPKAVRRVLRLQFADARKIWTEAMENAERFPSPCV